MSMTRRLLPACLAALLYVVPGGVAAADFTFDDLMANLSEHPEFTADFTEKRSSFLLNRPLELTGQIRFDADKRLEKIVESPFEEHITIDNDAVVIKRVNSEGKAATTHTTRYDLSNYPFLAKAVQGVSNVFAGDKQLLDELYNRELSGTGDDWELKLTPKEDKLAEFITLITIRGSGGVIDYIHTVEADDDESKLTLSNRTEP